MSANIQLPTTTQDFYTQADEMWEGANAYQEEMVYLSPAQLPRSRQIDVMAVGGFLVLLIMFYSVLVQPRTAVSTPNRAIPQSQATAVPVQPQPQPKPELSGDATVVVAPYANYQITQGLHGYSYGHMAIDLAAGRGEPVLSPINGVVSALYTDEYGNPTLEIENEVYVVLLLHGDYSVQIGDELKAGQVVGVESNKGYTMDMQGNLCYNREWCGNHTHLNVYDKRIRSNVNPFDLIN
ncbi:MAG: M23 family metallopeptidase [Chloroflexi bacterium]|nr:M23 family metallopeptidase [Chloroflexota bacterium]